MNWRTIAPSIVLTVCCGCGGTVSEVGTDEAGAPGTTPPGQDGGTGPSSGSSDASTGPKPLPSPDGSTGTPSDAGSTPSTPTIACGKKTCSADTEECCVTGQTEACTAKGKCNGVALECSGAASCAAGEVCCARQVRPDGGGGGGGRPQLSVTCASACTGGTEVCGSDSECGKNEKCQATFGGVSTCQRVRDGGLPPPPPGPPGNHDAG